MLDSVDTFIYEEEADQTRTRKFGLSVKADPYRLTVIPGYRFKEELT